MYRQLHVQSQPKAQQKLSQHTEAPVMAVFEHMVHDIWKEKAAVPVKRYDMDVEVGRYAAEMAQSL